jgi:chemotaxis protein CheX
MLDEQEIRTFLYGTTQYFEVAAQQPASVGSPYLMAHGAPEINEYTGVISVSGRRDGIVYFTAPRGMLTVLLMRMNESDVSHENLCDLVGEVANTISGNARRDFGNQFVISVPAVFVGRSEQVRPPNGCSSIVIPINWRSHSARLVVCLK